jgi:lipoprotein-anchoring transpeptidase ErfK/SrfK
MSDPRRPALARRSFLAGAAALGLAGRAGAQTENSTEADTKLSETIRRNISSFRSLSWEPYFTDTKNGAILVDTTSRALHFWSEDLSVYKLYPTSVPMTDDLTRKGRTEVTEKVVNPTWRPTPAMRERNPEWPEVIPGGDPGNPLGPLALYLSWQYYRIHGTHDTRKIGRRSSNGCIGLYNEHITELFALTKPGTQVLLV